MGKHVRAGNAGEEQAAEDLGDLDADPARIFAGEFPELGAGLKVVVVLDEVGGALHEHGPQAAMAAALQRSGGAIGAIALVAARAGGRASGDAVWGVGERDGDPLARRSGGGAAGEDGQEAP